MNHDHMVDATAYAFKSIEHNRQTKFRKHHYWRGFKVGLIIGLALACATVYLALYTAKICAADYHYSHPIAYEN